MAQDGLPSRSVGGSGGSWSTGVEWCQDWVDARHERSYDAHAVRVQERSSEQLPDLPPDGRSGKREEAAGDVSAADYSAGEWRCDAGAHGAGKGRPMAGSDRSFMRSFKVGPRDGCPQTLPEAV